MKKFLIFGFLTFLMANIVNTKAARLNGQVCCFDSECESKYCSGQNTWGSFCVSEGRCTDKPK